MNYLLLPDIAGLAVLMGVLFWARSRYPDESVDAWLVGLAFVLVESVAVAFYRSSAFFHSGMHAIALNAYVCAAVTFGGATRSDPLPGTRSVPLLFLPALPLLVITTSYGMEVQSPSFYRYLVVLSFILGIVYLIAALRTQTKLQAMLIGFHCAMWVPMYFFAAYGNLRWLVYWGLAFMYLLVATSFRGRLRRDGIGSMVIVTGFVLWSLCLILHPAVRSHPSLDAVLSRLWDMQKFFVIIGMLLVLLEGQTRKREEEAMHDALTGLPNRRLFDDRLHQVIARSRRSGSSAALFTLDLNGFKEINDTLGHAEGDRVLQLVAESLSKKVRASDTLVRCGGDEFSVIIADLHHEMDCIAIADDLRSSVVEVGFASHGLYTLSCSVGFALFPQEATEATLLCQLADSRMYETKRRQRSL